MHRLTILFVLCALFSLAMSASPPSFCKCTCFSNSTIIPLAAAHSKPNTDSQTSSLFTRASASSSCSQCNRAFCLSYKLPICKNAEEKDVFTTCFQRDSRKDQIIVLLFITTTVGLLAWAAFKKVMEKRMVWGFGGRGGQTQQAPTQAQGQYEPVSES